MNPLQQILTDLTDIFGAIAFVLNPPPLDPKRFAETPPKGWHGSNAVEVPNEHFFEIDEGGFAVGFDGQMMYSKKKSRADKRADLQVNKDEMITPEEYGALLDYKVSAKQTGLRNIPFAKDVKRLWKQGKTDSEIAILTGKSRELVCQYRTCLERASGNAKEI